MLLMLQYVAGTYTPVLLEVKMLLQEYDTIIFVFQIKHYRFINLLRINYLLINKIRSNGRGKAPCNTLLLISAALYSLVSDSL